MTVTPTYLTQNLADLWLITPGFDDLLLTGVTVDSGGNEFEIMAQDDGSTWGSPIPIDVAVQRWMADGAVASTQGYENREISFRVVVVAPTSTELAAGEIALAKRSATSCLLKWIPSQGAGVAPASVFEVWTWNFANEFDIDRENRLTRAYTITATARPWVRSEALTVVAAASVGATITSVDTCSSTTGWAGSPNPPSVVGGTKVNESSPTYGSGPAYRSAILTRTGSVTGLGTTPYLMIDQTFTGGSSANIFVNIDGGPYLVKAAQVGTVSYYKVPAGVTSFTTLQINGTAVVAAGGHLTLQVADVSKTDTLGSIATPRQVVRSLTPGGSVKTSGSIQVASPSATAIGTVLVHTYPDIGSGYTPPLRPFRTTGNTVTADSAAVSGSHEAFSSAGASAGIITYNVPPPFLREATYLVVARFFSTTNTTIFVQASASMTGGSVLDSAAAAATPVAVSSSGGSWGVIGTLSLPTQALPPESQVVQILTILGTGGTGTQTLDDVYLLDVTNGAVSLVIGGSATRLWLDAEDVDLTRNRPAVYLGTASDRSDAIGAGYSKVLNPGDHDLFPDGTVVYAITDNVDSPVVSASYYRRWHTNAGS